MTRPFAVLATAFLALCFLAAWTPPTAAQTPVDACSQQCLPQEADVNDPPVRRDGGVNVILYGHWTHILQPAMANTQPPDPQHEWDVEGGYTLPTIVTQAPCADCNLNFRNNEMSMSVITGPLSFGAPEGPECPIGCHFARLDIPLDPKPITAYAHFSADSRSMACPACPAQRVGGVMPGLMVEARYEQGPSTSHPEGFVAQGVSAAWDLVSSPFDERAWEVRIEMDAMPDERTRLVTEGQSVIQYRVYQVQQDGYEFQQSEWRARTGPDFPWRVILPVASPLNASAPAARVVERSLVVEWLVSSPLGFTDVDLASGQLSVVGHDGTRAGPVEYASTAFCNAVECHFAPVRMTWVVPLDRFKQLPSYTLELTALNSQGTYEVVATLDTPVAVFGGSSKSAPSAPLGAILVALAAAVFLARRR